jgi:predicted XRE-type DNA-binding protein
MAAEIRRLASTGTLAQHQIAAVLGINQGRVSEVLSGKRFSDLVS